MQELAKKRGLEKTGKPGKCLSKTYINTNTPLKWQCGKCGHIWQTVPYSIKNLGTWCPKCGWNYHTTIGDMQELAKKRGIEKTGKPGMCLSKTYINMNTPLKWQCGKCGYIWEAMPNSVKNNRSWCSKCAGKKKLTIEDMHKLAKKRGLEKTGKPGKCLSKTYINNKTHLKWKCGNCGFIWMATPKNIKKARWCPNCSKGSIERICRKFFELIFKAEFLTKSPKWLKNDDTGYKMHLDGYNDKLKVAFEYNGLQHYQFHPFYHRKSNDFKNQQNRDLLKKQLCEENGIILIVIPCFITPNNMQEYIITEYKKLTGILLTNIQKYNYRYFLRRKNNLQNFLN